VGCPDAVCAEIRNIPGVARVEFDQETKVFQVAYSPRFVTPDQIFAAVWEAGRKMGKEYLPREM